MTQGTILLLCMYVRTFMLEGKSLPLAVRGRITYSYPQLQLPSVDESIMNSKRKFRVGLCSRLMALAALFWFSMQFALVPNERGSSALLRNTPDVPSRNIVYAHIGKTGGEWIKSQLVVICKTRRNQIVKETCKDSFQVSRFPSTYISRQTVGYLHSINLFPKNAHELASHYLFSVRHPLTRLVSWYVYNHPQSCDPRESNSPACKSSDWKNTFFACFPNVEDLGNPKVLFVDPKHDECSKILWDGWYGRVAHWKDPNHLYWNYHVRFCRHAQLILLGNGWDFLTDCIHDDYW